LKNKSTEFTISALPPIRTPQQIKRFSRNFILIRVISGFRREVDRTALFRVVTQREAVIYYLRNYRYSLRNNPEERSSFRMNEFYSIYACLAVLFLNQITVPTLRLYGRLELHFGNTYVREKYLHENLTPFTSRQLCKKWLIWFCATLGSV
jgi:hypothetical protein